MSSADQQRRALEFKEDDHMCLRVTLMTDVGISLRSKNLTPKFIGLYQILRRVKLVPYQTALPPNFANLHNVFHVSQLRKYMDNHSHVTTPNEIQLKENISFEVPLMNIEDRSVSYL